MAALDYLAYKLMDIFFTRRMVCENHIIKLFIYHKKPDLLRYNFFNKNFTS